MSRQSLTPLILPADPVAAMEAATKQYVDGKTGVPSTRTISTTAPLTGGGDLSVNRTLAVSAATDTAPGVVELATYTEAVAGADTTRAVTPQGLSNALGGVAAGIKQRGTCNWTNNAALSDGQVLTSQITVPQFYNRYYKFTFQMQMYGGTAFVRIHSGGSFTGTEYALNGDLGHWGVERFEMLALGQGYSWQFDVRVGWRQNSPVGGDPNIGLWYVEDLGPSV